MREVARFADVYEAEVAASFLAACGVHAFVAERTIATMQPLLQTAVGGIRLLAPESQAKDAVDLLRMAGRGEFAADPTGEVRSGSVPPFGVVTALAALILGHGYAGRPYLAHGRLSAVHLCGMLLLGGALVAWISLWVTELIGWG